MSKLFNSLPTRETSPQASGRPLPTWQVKLSNGAVYGPIELDELRTWAEECRLAPGDQVSSDKDNWVNAETLPELTMQWMVEMTSGEIFGPVNLHAVVDFFHSCMVLPSSRLTNRVTGKKTTVADLVLPLIPDAARDAFPAEAPVVADNAASADQLIKFNRNTSTTRLSPDQHKETLPLLIEQLQATVDESESRIKQLQGDFDAQQAQTLKLRDDMAALEKTYDSTLNNIQEKESSLRTAIRERDLTLQSARALTARYEARTKKFDVQIDELVAHQQTSEREIEMRQTESERLNAALAEKEQHWAQAARDWDSIRSEKESWIQTLTRQIEVLTAEQTAMHSALEQNRAEFEQAHQETRKLATRAKELNERISVFDSQVQNVSENFAASNDDVAGQRERIEAITGGHLQKQTQLQTGIEELTGRLNAELETVQGELTRHAAGIKGMPERAISMENSVTEAGNEAEPQKIPCQGLQEQPGRTEGEFTRREMLAVTEKAKLARGYPECLERKGMITPVPDRRKMNYKSGKKVLVVDDNEVIQQLVIKLAEKHGASVTAVASARDVAMILAEKACRFDLFVIALILPEITGWEILETLRARPETKDTPIVILAGPLSSKEKENILQKANAVIEKGQLTLVDFNKVLNQWL